MTTELVLGGHHVAEGEMDDEGYRTYKISFLVKGSQGIDGPANILQTPGLPVPGSGWNHLSDVDVWVWYRPKRVVRPYQQKEGDPTEFWLVEMTASNKPLPRDKQRCGETPIEDPLLEPPKVSGSFIKYNEEATTAFRIKFYRGTSLLRTYSDAPITYSSFEQIRGAAVEFDEVRHSVRIEQNVATSYQAITLPAQLKNTLNDAPLWGVQARGIKFANSTWEKVYQGFCSVYYKRTLEFETYLKEDPDFPGTYLSGFDRLIIDESNKVLKGKWSATDPPVWLVDEEEDGPFGYANPENPANYIRAKDKHGEPIRLILNGEGVPWDAGQALTGTSDDQKGTILVQKHREANLLLLGIPVIL